MRCEQNEKHSQNDNRLQELVEILRIKMSMAIKLRILCLIIPKNSRYVCLPAKAEAAPGRETTRHTARAHYLRPFRLRGYRSP